MTTQAELLQLAEKYADNPAVKVLITSIKEATTQLKLNLKSAKLRIEIFEDALEKEDQDITGDFSHYAAYSSRIMGGVTRLTSDYMNLACILEMLGEKISY